MWFNANLLAILLLFPAFATAEDVVVPLAVTWKCKLIHKLPPAASIDKPHPDNGISPEAAAACAAVFDDAAWDTHQIPGHWEAYDGDWRDADGEAVFRLTLTLPDGWQGKDLQLDLGAIDDFDNSFFNGEQIGSVDKSVLGFWAVQRSYRVPGRLVKAGANTIAVRIFDHFGHGGFTGPKEKLVLRLAE